MRYTRVALWILAAAFLTAAPLQRKGQSSDKTQSLALPKDPPPVAIGNTRRLVFHVSPLSGKGPLSQQTRDALKAILKQSGGLPVVHLRAFVAGSGDVRRIPQIVSEVFSDKKMPLPSVSVVRAGGLPLESAQVVIEAVSLSKRDVNPGLDFIAAEESAAPDPAASTHPLLLDTLRDLTAKLRGAAPLQVSCFVSTFTDPAALLAAIATRFPSAAINLVQTQRSPTRALAACQAIAPGSGVTSEKLAFTGTRVAFGTLEKDALLAFQRLDRDLADCGAPPSGIVFGNIYPLSPQAAEQARKLRPATSPVSVVPVEAVASIDAGFAIDAVAPVK